MGRRLLSEVACPVEVKAREVATGTCGIESLIALYTHVRIYRKILF